MKIDHDSLQYRGEILLEEFPTLYIHRNGEGSSLIRVIDETPAEPEAIPLPVFKFFSWANFKYNFLEHHEPPSKKKVFTERIIRKEILVENVDTFLVEENQGKYVVRYR